MEVGFGWEARPRRDEFQVRIFLVSGGDGGLPEARGYCSREKAALAVLGPCEGGKACWLIRKHDHFTPTRENRGHVRN